MKKLLFTLILLFSFQCNVFAAITHSCATDIEAPDPACGIEVKDEQTQNINPGTSANCERGKKLVKLMYIVDDSGSMNNDKSKEGAAKQMCSFVNELSEKKNKISKKSKVFVYFFNSGKVGKLSNKTLSEWYKNCKSKTSRKKMFSSFDSGTNTNFDKGLSDAISEVEHIKKDSKEIPIVAFITDGYPNYYKSKSKATQMGWLSSARFFYDATAKMIKLKKELTNDERKNKGVLITAALEFGAEDKMATYFLSGVMKNDKKDKKDDEFDRFRKMIEGDKSSFYEIVAGIGAHPEKGIVGFSQVSKDYKSVLFDNLDALSNNENGMESGYGLLIGPVNSGSKGSKLCYSNSTSGDFKSKNCIKSTGFHETKGNPNYGFLAFLFKKNTTTASKFAKAKRWKLVSSKKMTFRTYSGSGKRNMSGIVDSFSPNVGTKHNINWEKANSAIDKAEGIDCQPNPVEDIIHTGICTDGRIKEELDEGKYRKTCSYTEYVSDDCCTVKQVDGETKCFANSRCPKSKTKDIDVTVKISMNYLTVEEFNFDAGTLKENQIAIAGSGFPFYDQKINYNYDVYPKKINNDVPYVRINGMEPDDDCGIVSVNDEVPYSDSKLSGTKHNNDWKDEIVNDIEEDIKDDEQKVEFSTIDSNDVNNDSADVSVEQKKTSSERKKRTYEYKVKEAYYKQDKGYGTFSYEEESDSNPVSNEKHNYYYIPFGYVGEQEIPISITIKSLLPYESQTSFDDQCSVNVYTQGYPDNYITYRTIDLNDPFPKSNYNYNKIPINWRDWYCLNGNCKNNNININRLRNSYNKMDYKTTTNTVDNDDNYDYSSFFGISNDGKSSFVENNINSGKVTYCPLGICNKLCDCGVE